jgi:outer membrane protein assembly factor BamB
MFGHDPAHTGYTDSTPIKVAPKVLWKIKILRPVSDSVAIWNGYVYIATEGDRLFAINASTGQKVWEKYHSGSGGTPAVENGIVYASQYDGGTAYNATTGETIWTLNSTVPTFNSFYSPTVADGAVYLTNDTNLCRVNASTGALIWSIPASTDSPAVAGDRIFTDRGAYNATTGELLWSTNGLRIITSFSTRNSFVYFASYDNSIHNIYCVDAANGRKVWNYSTDSLPLAIADGRVFGSSDGKIFALNSATGDRVWSYQIGPLVSSTAIAQDVVYVASRSGSLASHDGNLYAFDVSSGALLWSFPIQDLNDAGKLSRAAPVVSNGTIYIGSNEGYLYALTEPTAQEQLETFLYTIAVWLSVAGIVSAIAGIILYMFIRRKRRKP